MSSQYCKPAGSDPVWRCPVCGQWWRLDLPNGDFWEPISTLKAFLFYHPKWRAAPPSNSAPSNPTRPATRSTRRTPDMYRGTITLALLRWIGHLEQFSQITNQQDKDDA